MINRGISNKKIGIIISFEPQSLVWCLERLFPEKFDTVPAYDYIICDTKNYLDVVKKISSNEICIAENFTFIMIDYNYRLQEADVVDKVCSLPLKLWRIGRLIK